LLHAPGAAQGATLNPVAQGRTARQFALTQTRTVRVVQTAHHRGMLPDPSDLLNALPLNWPHRQYSSFHAIAGLQWHVQRAGNGPTLLFLHGTGGATHTWHHILPALATHADVIAIDLPGHGFTTGATPAHLSLTGMATAVAALLRALDVHPVIGIGHSAGAAVLLQLASQVDIAPSSFICVNSALVSVSPLGQMLLPVARSVFDVALVRDVVAAGMQSGTLARRVLRTTGTVLAPEQEARYITLLTGETRVGAVLQMMSRWDLPDLEATFPRITQRVTLVHSRNEPWVNFGELMAATSTLPDRAVIDLTPAGHLIPDEKPDALLAIIRDEVARLR
jgi:magnesium chelatase accessory protein